MIGAYTSIDFACTGWYRHCMQNVYWFGEGVVGDRDGLVVGPCISVPLG